MPVILLAVTLPSELVKSIDSNYPFLASYGKSALSPHITLIPPFNVRDEEVNDVIKKLSEELSLYDKFSISLDSVDSFTGENNVIYLEPDTDSYKRLSDINKEVTSIVDNFIDKRQQEKAERPFIGHVTLGKKIPNENFLDLLEKTKMAFNKLEFVCESISVYQLNDNWIKLMDISLNQDI